MVNQTYDNSADFFRDFTLRICGNLNIDRALSETFEYLENYIPVDAVVMVYIDFAQSRAVPVSVVVREGVSFVKPIEMDQTKLNEEYLQHERNKEENETFNDSADEPAVVVANSPDSQHQGILRSFPQLKTFSMLSLQLKIKGQKVGKFIVFAQGQDRYLKKDADLLESVREPIAIALSNARRYLELSRLKDRLQEDNRELSADIKRIIGAEVVGADFGLRQVMEQVRRVAQTRSPVLLLGETGTGKEIIANAIHMTSSKRKSPLISMQCGAIPETLLDSELFGHERGAFTGASERKRGRFERADSGTLFLDEIGELSSDAQVKLLRVLQERKFERVGGTQTIEVDVRIIAATHRDLEEMIRKEQFREDLWYRLNVFPIRIPPLRERKEDIPSLVQFFVTRKAKEMNLAYTPKVKMSSLKPLEFYNWPGNVRELQNIVERALILSQDEYLSFPPLVVERLENNNNYTLQNEDTLLTMDQTISRQICLVLEHTGGKIEGRGGAAEILQVKPSTLRFRMKKLGIKKQYIKT